MPVSEVNMGDQLFLSINKPKEELFNPVTGMKHNKKPIGGIWTSTKYINNLGFPTSSFIEWSKGNLKISPEYSIWGITIENPVNVLIINKKEDIINYSTLVEENTIDERYEFDIDYIHKDLGCNGIWLTEKGVENTCSVMTDRKYSMKSWDVESTIWFDWVFDSINRLRSYD